MKYGIFPDEIIVSFGGDGKGEMVWEDISFSIPKYAIEAANGSFYVLPLSNYCIDK